MSLRPSFARLPFLMSAAALAAALGFGAATSTAAAPPAASTPASAPVFHSARAVSASAPVSPDGPSWNELSNSQRKVLAPLAVDWNGLDGRSKERWLDVAGRFHKMPVEEQQRANQRMVEWAHMTVAERTEARMNFQESRSVSKEERQARWKAYQALPEEKKRELAKRAAAPASAASTTAALARRRPDAGQPRPAGAGATTPLLTRRATPPAHQRDGLPKIAASPTDVDRTTLLPKRGPQATVSAAASSSTRMHP